MAIANNTTHNGYDPRPGTVHRPTRAAMPTVQGPVLPPPPYAGNQRGVYNPRAYLAPADRTMTTGRTMPTVTDTFAALDAHGLTKHVVIDGDAIEFKPDTPAAIRDIVLRVVARLDHPAAG